MKHLTHASWLTAQEQEQIGNRNALAYAPQRAYHVRDAAIWRTLKEGASWWYAICYQASNDNSFTQ
jgi:hypothetical protein